MKVSATNFYGIGNSKIKVKNNNTSPAFKGITEEPLRVNEYDFVSFNILGQNMHDYFMGYENRVKSKKDSPEKISEFLAKNIKEYNKRFDNNRYFDKTSNKNSTKLYVADPNEVITESIREKHGYIVYDNEPAFPSLEQLQKKYTSKSTDKHNYFKDLQDYADYQKRAIEADKKRIEKINNQIEEPNKLKYRKRIKQAELKLENTENLLNILAKNGDDFVQRDVLVNEINYIMYEYPLIDNKLKDIEFHKYLTDESIEGNERLVKSFDKNDPSVYYHRCGVQHSIDNAKERSIQLQQEYDRCVELKQNGQEKVKNLENQLSELLNKMTKDFEILKKYYTNNNLDLL